MESLDSKPKMEKNPETKDDQSSLSLALSASVAPFASFSVSLSTLVPSQILFFQNAKISTLFSQPPNKVKLAPTQASSLATHLSLSSSPLAPHRNTLSFRSSVAANPLRMPLSLGPRRPTDPSGAAALRRATVVWFRNDLRVHDNECLNSAHSDSVSVLPVYCFDPRDYGKSSSGFDKTGPYRASFLIESVADLRRSLQARGSDLVVRVGRPDEVLKELAKAVGAEAVYAHREVSHDEVRAEERIEAAMKEENVEVKYFWGSTLYHLEDLPFKLEDMPANYGGFRERLRGSEVRKTIASLDQMKGLPSQGDVEAGDIPTLTDLGISPAATVAQGVKPVVNGSMVGGETEALEKLRKFAAECQVQPHKGSKDGGHDSIYGANFSCKISPWLTMGCLSPRSVFDELKKTASRTISASSNKKDGGSGMNWLLFELLWRDFFRFITKKYSSAKKQLDNAPATACTSALA